MAIGPRGNARCVQFITEGGESRESDSRVPVCLLVAISVIVYRCVAGGVERAVWFFFWLVKNRKKS